MFAKSCMDLMNLVSVDDFGSMNPREMRVPGVISRYGTSTDDEEEEDYEDDYRRKNGVVSRRIIVANQLPVHAFRDEESKKWRFEYDRDRVIVHINDEFGGDVEVVHVGCLKAEIDESEQDDVALELWKKFRCVPVFLTAETLDRFYHGFCKHYIWPLFHYMLPMSPSHGARYDRQLWQAYVAANKEFADKVMQVINPEADYVWIHDYHLMVLPGFLRKRCHRIKLGFFLHSPFPSSEIYRTIPVRQEILESLLNCNVIGFHTFDYARHFLSCCSRMLGLDYISKRGYIGLEYCGRTVSVKISPVGIYMSQLQSVLSLPETAKKVKELKEQFEGKIVMLGVDDMDMFKGISLKFLAMRQLLEENNDLRGRVVLVQITNPVRSHGKDVQDVQSEMSDIIRQINQKYGEPGYEPIVLLDGPVSSIEKAAYFAISECCVVSAVRDGLNLVPHKYTVCRQGSPVLDKALGINEPAPPKTSMIIVSEFIGCSPSLSGAIRVNPWNTDDVCNAMVSAVTMPDVEKHLRHEKHYKYISSHDVGYWARSFDQDLVRSCKSLDDKRVWGMGLGFGFKVVALSNNFRKLRAGEILSAYKKTQSRLILLDYDGTVMPGTSAENIPSVEVISILNSLCSDPKNNVFIVSGRGRHCLSQWFSSCEKLGISAEHGYFTRWTRDSSWKTCPLIMDFDWKNLVLPILEHYTEATDGSFIEQKESALVWHHQQADPLFASCQSKELLDHLENVLANEPVVVKRGQGIVEVKPQGVSKGIAVEKLISTMKSGGKAPDFVLCIGDDRSDEDMFETISSEIPNQSLLATAEVFACSVGQKPSKAKYFVDDTDGVIELLKDLVKGSSMHAKLAQLKESFEAYLSNDARRGQLNF